MKSVFRKRPWLEVLEDRTVPALLLQLDSFGNLTGIFGVPDGDVALTFTGADEINVVEDGNDLGTYSVVGNLTVSLGNVLAATAVDVLFDDNAFSGSMNIALGNALGGYTLNFDGGAGNAGSIAGNLTVRTGSGPDAVALGSDGGVGVGGNVSVNTGANDDLFDIGDDTTVEGNVTAVGINSFTLFDTPGAPALIEGNLSLTANEAISNFFFIDGDVNGSLFIKGANGPTTGPSDTVDIQGTILGNVIATLRNGANVLAINSTAVIAGSVVVTGGNQTDVVSLDSTGAGGGAIVLGNVTVNLKNGSNSFIIDTDSSVLGAQITYLGGNNDDEVTFDGDAPGARLTALMGAGVDTFNLLSANLASLFVDFGAGVDDLVLGAGLMISFPTTFRNLP